MQQLYLFIIALAAILTVGSAQSICTVNPRTGTCTQTTCPTISQCVSTFIQQDTLIVKVPSGTYAGDCPGNLSFGGSGSSLVALSIEAEDPSNPPTFICQNSIFMYYEALGNMNINITSINVESTLQTTANGGCLSIHGSTSGNNLLRVTNSKFIGCTTAASGGAIYASNFQVSISASSFFNARATSEGGAVYVNQILNVAGSTFQSCQAGTNGGAIASVQGSIHVTDSVFLYCSSSNFGGALKFDSSILMKNTSFSSCTADYGGALAGLDNSLISTTKSVFDSNTATNGGAVYYTGDPFQYTSQSTRFSNNSATSGGAIAINPTVYRNSGFLILFDSTFVGNSASNLATDVYYPANLDATVSGGKFYTNFATEIRSFRPSFFDNYVIDNVDPSNCPMTSPVFFDQATVYSYKMYEKDQ
eukprot:gene13074-15378_t